MALTAGFEIVRVAEIPWEDRRNVDNWPSRAGMFCDDKANQLCIRLIDYPKGSTEPRHVHGGMHATTVLKHHTIVDGITLRPLDVVLGPSNEPHGPLHYPDSCQLLSAFQGSYYHSEVEKLSTEKHYRLIQQEQLPWVKGVYESVGGEGRRTVRGRCFDVVREQCRCGPQIWSRLGRCPRALAGGGKHQSVAPI